MINNTRTTGEVKRPSGNIHTQQMEQSESTSYITVNNVKVWLNVAKFPKVNPRML